MPTAIKRKYTRGKQKLLTKSKRAFLPYLETKSRTMCLYVIRKQIITDAVRKTCLLYTSIVSDMDARVASSTFFIKSLTSDAETLLGTAKSESLKTAAKKVYEAIRYSDPMSASELAGIESQISYKFNDFSSAVNAVDEKSAAEYLSLIHI